MLSYKMLEVVVVAIAAKFWIIKAMPMYMFLYLILFILALTFKPGTAFSGEIYKTIDQNGTIRIGDSPTSDQPMPNISSPKTTAPYGKGWTCDSGYKRAYDKCIPVMVPPNASLDFSGHDWVCNQGYKKSYNSCILMTNAEIQKQKELERTILEKIQRRRIMGVSGDDCETEYKMS